MCECVCLTLTVWDWSVAYFILAILFYRKRRLHIVIRYIYFCFVWSFFVCLTCSFSHSIIFALSPIFHSLSRLFAFITSKRATFAVNSKKEWIENRRDERGIFLSCKFLNKVLKMATAGWVFCTQVASISHLQIYSHGGRKNKQHNNLLQPVLFSIRTEPKKKHANRKPENNDLI